MLIILLVATLVWQRAGAIPISPGAATVPTVIHSVVFGVYARNGCSDVRSMYDILRSCLFTIAACVYRAIHPNIPDPTASFWTKLRVTIKMTFYALIAPEAMIFWALRQRVGASIVAEKVNKLRPELRWTQTHGQFAQMGGFGRKDNKHILHPPTLIELLKSNQLDIEELQITEKEINDKSKGDILSKGLVAFQTTWFVFECLARLQQGLPIIELEVVTLAFATLNAITYGMWWYKPLNVSCPIYLHIRPMEPLPSTDSESLSSEIPPNQKLDEVPLLGGRDGVQAESDTARVEIVTEEKGLLRNIATWVRVAIKDVMASLQSDVEDEGWGVVWIWLIEKPFLAIAHPLWDLLNDERVHDEANHVSIFYSIQIPAEKGDLVAISSSLIGTVFGAIHFISWNSTFPTHAQLVIWRTSSIVMVIEPFLILLTNLFVAVYHRAPSGSWRRNLAESVGVPLQYVALFGGTIPYILARFSVLVLAFLTLRDLSLDVFTNVSWTSYIPHF